MNGKGSKRRPMAISRESFEENWHLVFGERDPHGFLDRLPEVEECEQAIARRAERLQYMRELKRRAK